MNECNQNERKLKYKSSKKYQIIGQFHKYMYIYNFFFSERMNERELEFDHIVHALSLALSYFVCI